MYSFDSRVRYSEVDADRKLSVTGIMNYLQDCSTFQSEDLGIGIAYLESCHRAWWLSSWQIVIERHPKLGEHLTIGTWPYDFKGMYGYRNFVIRDQDGENLVKANSVWFFYDTLAGRPVKARVEDIRGYGNGEEARLEMNYAPRRIFLPAFSEQGDPIEVARHHIDTNHHVNNAQYVEIARKALPEEVRIREIRVEYKRAAVLGDLLYPCIKREKDHITIALCDSETNPYAVIWLQVEGAQAVSA